MKKWLMNFGTTFAVGMLLILAVGVLGRSLREDVPEETVNAVAEEILESAKTDESEIEELAVEVQEEEPDPVGDPSLIWKYEGIENSIEPRKNMISVDKVRNNPDIMHLWISTVQDFESEDVVIYVDGQMVGYMYAAERNIDRSFPISSDKIAEGLHSAEIVQYANSNDENGEIIFYVRTTYEIK